MNNNDHHTIYDPNQLAKQKQLKFYPLIAMLFTALFVVVNIITQKIVPLGGFFLLTAGDFIYPLLYILSILLTEVYGYAMSRRVIWGAFFANIVVALVIYLAIILPYDPSWLEQQPFELILARTPRILGASLMAFLIGEFIGTYMLAKIKLFTQGRHLWLRTTSATLVGQAIDSFIFTSVAFLGIVSFGNILILSFSAYFCKIIYQLVFTPTIYSLAKFLKQRENIDIFDRHTNFNPFNLGLK